MVKSQIDSNATRKTRSGSLAPSNNGTDDDKSVSPVATIKNVCFFFFHIETLCCSINFTKSKRTKATLFLLILYILKKIFLWIMSFNIISYLNYIYYYYYYYF